MSEKFADQSSRRFTMPARVVREATRLGILKRGMRILEVGSGALRNATWLARHGLTVDVVELRQVVEKYRAEYADHRRQGGKIYHRMPRRRYAAVLSTFVLGTITPRRARVILLREMRKRLASGAPIIIAVRGPGDVKTKTRAGRRWRDGFLTPGGTFIKPIRQLELLDLCARAGLQPHALCVKLRSHSGIVDVVLEAAR